MKNRKETFYQKYIKIILDFLISLIGLFVLSPVLLIIAIAIKIDSKGPVFFKQKDLEDMGKCSIYINLEL